MSISEHPLVHDANNLSDEELMLRISDLQKKQGTAMRSGNSSLANQVAMALATYQNVYQERLRKSHKSDDEDFGGSIDIS